MPHRLFAENPFLRASVQPTRRKFFRQASRSIPVVLPVSRMTGGRLTSRLLEQVLRPRRLLASFLRATEGSEILDFAQASADHVVYEAAHRHLLGNPRVRSQFLQLM